ncbi:hypothetical protein [Thalassospira lucentensis]|uniref:hypothetical protein n=1 Tax=Thalassospira lucentensis TaxID=168935 RepID=UPI0029429B89|nr:hypothetical protein [Thalassospira lucentensis]WOI09125.1 hypothetical protein R1T41_11340 [Thalassospira lucentensis]
MTRVRCPAVGCGGTDAYPGTVGGQVSGHRTGIRADRIDTGLVNSGTALVPPNGAGPQIFHAGSPWASGMVP